MELASSGADLRMLYTIGAIVGLLILILVSFVLNSRRVNKIEQILEDLSERMDSLEKANKALNSKVSSLSNGSYDSLSNVDLEALAETKAFTSIKQDLDQVKAEQDNYYKSILNEQSGLKHELSQLKTLLSSLPVSSMAKAASKAAQQNSVLKNNNQKSEHMVFADNNQNAPAQDSFDQDDSGIFMPPGSTVNLPFNESEPLPQKNVNYQAQKLAEQKARSLGQDPMIAMAEHAYAHAQAKGLVDQQPNAENFDNEIFNEVDFAKSNQSVKTANFNQAYKNDVSKNNEPTAFNQGQRKSSNKQSATQNGHRNPSDPLGMSKNRNHNSNFTQTAIGSELDFAQDAQASDQVANADLSAQNGGQDQSNSDFSFTNEHNSLNQNNLNSNLDFAPEQDRAVKKGSGKASLKHNKNKDKSDRNKSDLNRTQETPSTNQGFAFVDIPVKNPALLVEESKSEENADLAITNEQAQELVHEMGEDQNADQANSVLKEALALERLDQEEIDLDQDIKNFTNKLNSQEADLLSKDLAHNLETGTVSTSAFVSSIKGDLLITNDKAELFNPEDFKASDLQEQKSNLSKQDFDLASASDELRFDALDSFTRLYTNARKKQLEKEKVVKEAQELKKVASLGNFNQKEDFEKSLKAIKDKNNQNQSNYDLNYQEDINLDKVSYKSDRLTDLDYAQANVKPKEFNLEKIDSNKDSESFDAGFSYYSVKDLDQNQDSFKQSSISDSNRAEVLPNSSVVNMITDEDFVKHQKDKKPNGIDLNTLGKVRSFIEAGVPLEEIAATTGLSVEELSLLYDVDSDGNNKPAKLKFEGKLDESIKYENDGKVLDSNDLNQWSQENNVQEQQLNAQLEDLEHTQINDLKVVDEQSLLQTAVKDDKPYLALDSDEKKTIEQMMEGSSSLDQSHSLDGEIHDNEEEELEQKLSMGLGSNSNQLDSSLEQREQSSSLDYDPNHLNEEDSLKDALAKGHRSSLNNIEAETDPNLNQGSEVVEDEIQDLVQSLRNGANDNNQVELQAEIQTKSVEENKDSLQSSNFVDHLNEEELQELGLDQNSQGSITSAYLDSRDSLENIQDFGKDSTEASSLKSSLEHKSHKSQNNNDYETSTSDSQEDNADEVDDLANSLIESNENYQKEKELRESSIIEPRQSSYTEQSDPLNILGDFKKHNRLKEQSNNALNDHLENNADYLQNLNADLNVALSENEDYVDLHASKRQVSQESLRSRAKGKISSNQSSQISAQPLTAGSVDYDQYKQVANSIDPLASLQMDDSYVQTAPLALGSIDQGSRSGDLGGSVGGISAVGASTPQSRYNRNTPRQQERFSNVSRKNPGMADVMSLGQINAEPNNAEAGAKEVEDPSSILSKVLSSGLNSVSELTKEQLDTLNQLQQPVASPAVRSGQHYANLQARNAYGISKSKG